ncbi:MAG: DNA primase [Alphaproteobacteria bacterium]
MAFPPQFLDELRARQPISSIAGRRVKLIRRGREYVALCPFHSEKTPSFTISDDKGFYHCFGCGAHGDVISFVAALEGLDFREAVARLAGEAGLALPRERPEDREQADRMERLYRALELACAWFEQQLAAPVGRPARDYLAARGVDEATIGRFRLGYAPDGRGRLSQALTAQGVEKAQLTEVGLVKAPEGGGETRDYFFNRVIFPITDRRGRVIAFGGRSLGEAGPKYLNSPETPLFRKGRVLYAWAMGREAARETGELIVAEGYTDVIALNRVGLAQAVAPLGTALTEEQIVELWRLADEPVLCFDGDAAGERAALRAAERALPLLSPGKSLGFVTLPPGEDPDSLIRAQGVGRMREVLASARPLVDVIWLAETRGRGLDTPERRAELERALSRRARAIADGDVQRQYLSEFRDRTWKLFRGSGRRPGKPDKRPGKARPAGGSQTAAGLGPRGDVGAVALQEERAMLALLLNHPGLIERHAEALSRVTLDSPPLDRILREILNLAARTRELDTAGLRRHLSEHGHQEPVETVLSARVYQLASFAAPDSAPETAESVLGEFLAAHERRRMAADRDAAERDLAHDMTEAKSERLRAIVREQVTNGMG